MDVILTIHLLCAIVYLLLALLLAVHSQRRAPVLGDETGFSSRFFGFTIAINETGNRIAIGAIGKRAVKFLPKA